MGLDARGLCAGILVKVVIEVRETKVMEEMAHSISKMFPKYTEFAPVAPVWCVTPNLDRTIHRFFDTSPFSPSGRYLGLTRLPYEDRLPAPGDVAEIILVDLSTGENRVVAESRGWDTQLGAQVQWGATDNELFFNDLDTTTWRPFGVVLDPFSGAKRMLDGTVYMVSPDGKWAASPCLLRTGATQPGYGVIVPPEHVPVNHGPAADDGLYITDTKTGKSGILVSIEEIVRSASPTLDSDEFADGDFYGFHVKWNPQGNRIMLVLRWVPRQRGARTRAQVVTMRADGSHICVAIPASEWDKGGHHPNWCPDGESVMMNLRVRRRIAARLCLRLFGRLGGLAFRSLNIRMDGMRLVRARYDGSRIEAMNDRIVGTGHPSLHPNGRHVITDAYPNEPVAFGDGTTPIRLIDLQRGQDINLVRIKTSPSYSGPRNELRVDPHPAWDRSFSRIAFNACADGTRRVYVADLSSVLA